MHRCRLLAVPLLLTGCTLIADVDRTQIETEAGSGTIEGGLGGSGGGPTEGGMPSPDGGPAEAGVDAPSPTMEGGAGTGGAMPEAGLDAGDAAG
jgi:hypothetical protein